MIVFVDHAAAGVLIDRATLSTSSEALGCTLPKVLKHH